MVTEIDLWAIKTRIRDILENDTVLAAYFRLFQVGAPNGNIPEDCPMPYVFVTNDEGLVEEDEEATPNQGVAETVADKPEMVNADPHKKP